MRDGRRVRTGGSSGGPKTPRAGAETCKATPRTSICTILADVGAIDATCDVVTPNDVTYVNRVVYAGLRGISAVPIASSRYPNLGRGMLGVLISPTVDSAGLTCLGPLASCRTIYTIGKRAVMVSADVRAVRSRTCGGNAVAETGSTIGQGPKIGR